jgi:hypothetical protein
VETGLAGEPNRRGGGVILPHEAAQCSKCGDAAEFGYKIEGAMQWYCDKHKISQNYADARVPKAGAQQTKQIARPLHVLLPLIKEELKKADEAARAAGLPYYLAVGQLLLEAKAQLDHGEFMRWVKRNLNVKHRQATNYMAYAKQQSGTECQFERVDTLSQFLHENRNRYTNNWRDKPPSIDADRIRAESLKREEERRALLQLCVEIIGIGYKALAAKMHPDKGGSAEAMTRLNQARDYLKGFTFT